MIVNPKKNDQAIRMKPSYNPARKINHHQNTIHMNHFNTPYSNGKNKIIIDVHVTELMNSSISYQELEEDP